MLIILNRQNRVFGAAAFYYRLLKRLVKTFGIPNGAPSWRQLLPFTQFDVNQPPSITSHIDPKGKMISFPGSACLFHPFPQEREAITAFWADPKEQGCASPHLYRRESGTATWFLLASLCLPHSSVFAAPEQLQGGCCRVVTWAHSKAVSKGWYLHLCPCHLQVGQPHPPHADLPQCCRDWWSCESPSWRTEPSLCCQVCSPPALLRLPPLCQHRCFLSGLLLASSSTAALSTSEGLFREKWN